MMNANVIERETECSLGGSSALARQASRSRLLTDGLADAAERLLVLALYGWLVLRLIEGYSADGRLANLLLLPSEGLVVFFLLIRRPAQEISTRASEWALAFAATCAPMLVAPTAGAGLLSPTIAATILLMGIVIQVLAKIRLGRSIGCVPAHRGLQLAGPYRFVRHPMYAGYLLSHFAFLAMNPTWWNLFIYILCYGLQVPRLLAEERLLSRDPRYQQYLTAIRYRLIPGIF